MSFSFSFRAAKSLVKEALEKVHNVPQHIKDFVEHAVGHYPDGTTLDVAAHGHVHDGQPGNYDVTTANVTVKKAT